MKFIYEADPTGANPGPVALWIARQIPWAESFGKCASIGVCGDDGLIAGCVYNEFDGRNVAASIAATDKRWCTREVLRTLFAYPFNQLRVHRMTALVPSKNEKSIKLCRGLGFRHEGTVRELFSRRNHGLAFGMLRSECRWLGEKHG